MVCSFKGGLAAEANQCREAGQACNAKAAFCRDFTAMAPKAMRHSKIRAFSAFIMPGLQQVHINAAINIA
jgi:hypothetical protein